MFVRLFIYCRNVLISPNNDFELLCKGRHDRVSQSLGVFNEKQRKKFLLPMPALGWRLAILKFVTTDGQEYPFIFDGVPEQALVRPSTAPPATSNERKSKSRQSMTSSSRPMTASYLRTKTKPMPRDGRQSSLGRAAMYHPRWQ